MNEIIYNIFLISAMSTSIILIMLIMRKLIGKSIGTWWRSIVWMILLIRLCIPLSINSPFSIYDSNKVESIISFIRQSTTFKEAESQKYTIESPLINESVVPDENSDSNPNIDETTISVSNKDEIKQPSSDNEASSLIQTTDNIVITDYSTIPTQKTDWLSISYIVYLCGFFASVLYLVFRMITLSLSMKRYEICENKDVLYLFEQVKNQMDVTRNIEILIDKNKSVPSLAGTFKTKLILPEKTILKMTPEQLEYVFIHELTHFKRMDILKLWFVEFVLCIHWFNPVLHHVKSVVRQDIELSCDEKIISKLKDTTFIKYCNVLVISSIKNYRHLPGVITANLAGRNGKKLKERLTMINNFNKKRVWALGIVLLILTSFILVSCTTLSTNDEETNLGITPDEMNEKLDYIVDQHITTHSILTDRSIKLIDNRSNETITKRQGKKTISISYPLLKDEDGSELLTISYIMAKDDIHIREILLEKAEDTNGQRLIVYTDVMMLVSISYIMARNDISDFSMFDISKFRNLGVEGYNSEESVKVEKDETSTKILPYTTKEIKARASGLNITPNQVDEKIKYLLENNWLDTKLKFNPDDAYLEKQDGKTIIKHPITTESGEDITVILEYVLAPDNEHIETIMTENKSFFDRGLNQEVFIDLNLIVNKAYELAKENKNNLNDKIASDDKPIYMIDLKEDTVTATLLDSSNNLYATVVVSSLSTNLALAPITNNIDDQFSYSLGWKVDPEDVSNQINSLINDKYIDTNLSIDIENFTVYDVSDNYNNTALYTSKAAYVSASIFRTYIFNDVLESIVEYPIITDDKGTNVLSLYYLVDSIYSYHIKDLFIVYKKYLGNDETDKLYKDLCILTDSAVWLYNNPEKELQDVNPKVYESENLYDWDYDERLNVIPALDHETIFTIVGESISIPTNENLPYYVDERHPHLGTNLDEMNHILASLTRYPEFNEINISDESIVKENSEGSTTITYPVTMTSKDKPVLSYSFELSEDSIHIETITITLEENRVEGNDLEAMRAKYFALRDMIDSAFVMVKEGITSYDDFFSENYPFPTFDKSKNPSDPMAGKIFNNEVYVVNSSSEMLYQQQIMTASPIWEIIYSK